MDAVVKRQPFEQVAESVKTTIVLLREKNLTVNEIAAHPAVIGQASPTFVRTYLAKVGMYSPKPRKKFDVELMRSLRAQKKTYREIGAVLNCSEVTVQNYLRLPVADTDEALAAKIAESEAVTENLRAQQRERETRVEIDGDTLDIYGLMEYNPDGSHVVPTTKAQAKRWLRDGGVQKLREALGM